MRIILTADIHFGNMASLEGDGPFTLDEHKKFAAKLHAEKPDILIVAGDCAESAVDWEKLFEFFRLYKNPHGVSLCVPGNHDLWIPQGSASSVDWRSMYERFHAVATNEGWVSLRKEPWVKDGLCIVGHMGWFDFSSRDDSLGMTPDDYERWRDWSDYEWMRLKDRSITNPMAQINKEMMAELDEALSKVPPDRTELLVFTHYVGFPRLMTKFRNKDPYQAYFGNFSIGERVVKAKADAYFCGHSHRQKEIKQDKMRCINNGSGYGRGSKRFDILERVPK